MINELCLKQPEGDTYYWFSDIGSEITLVFLPGLSADHRLFDNQMRYFEDKYNCLTWDAPMHGKSRPFSGFSYPFVAKTLRKIFEENGIDNPVIVGQSVGGYFAQSFMKAYPNVVKGFIGIDSSPYGEKYYDDDYKQMLTQAAEMFKAAPFDELKSSIAQQCASRETAKANMLEMLQPYSQEEFAELMGQGYNGFLEDNCDIIITCPVMLMAGELDVTGKLMQFNKEWAEDLGKKLFLIKDAAHNSNDDNPEMVNELIEKFVEDEVK